MPGITDLTDIIDEPKVLYCNFNGYKGITGNLTTHCRLEIIRDAILDNDFCDDCVNNLICTNLKSEDDVFPAFRVSYDKLEILGCENFERQKENHELIKTNGKRHRCPGTP